MTTSNLVSIYESIRLGSLPDDADREEHEPQPILEWIKRAKETSVIDFAALEQAERLESELFLDTISEEVGKREEMIRELHGQLSLLCAAIESHPFEQENDFVRQERERARKLLERYGSDVHGMNNRALDQQVHAHGMGQEATRDMFVSWLIEEGADDLVSKIEANGGWPPIVIGTEKP